MSGASQLAVRPELCDRCGACVAACPAGRLRVGAGYIYVDTSACTGCHSCVEACKRGAIIRRTLPARPVARRAPGSDPGGAVAAGEATAAAGGTPGGVPMGKVVVGSRAEAKAVHKAAADAEKARARQRTERPASSRADERRGAAAGPSGASWTVVDAAAVAAVLLATLVAKEAVLGSTAVSLMPPSGRIVVRTTVLGVFYAIQLALLFLLARRRGLNLTDAFRLHAREVSARDWVISVGLVVALLVATRAFSTAWGAISQALGWSPPSSDALTGIFGGGGAGLVLTVVMVVVVAPFVEELAFRGVIAGALGGRFGVLMGILGSAAIFAVYHLTAWVLLPTFALGCALGWLASSRRTLWPAIALHALYNGVVVAAAFWLPST